MRSLCLMAVIGITLCACRDQSQQTLRIAVTTSTRDSGLLDHILPDFQAQHNVRVDVLTRGTGAAIALGLGGDVDLIIVHDKKAEDQFMATGLGARHERLFSNEFVLVGPADDPAKIKNLGPLDAFKKLASQSNKSYVSRGDDSGTHAREKELLALAGLGESIPGAIETGRGMGDTLNIADQMRAYLLTDNATFYRFAPNIDLEIMVQKDDQLKNHYSAIVISSDLRTPLSVNLANRLCDYFLSQKIQNEIAAFECGNNRPFFARER